MKLITKYLLISLIFLIRGNNSLAQYYSTGQDPASAKWRQIKTENFQIIFQKDFEDNAQEIANILEYNYLRVGKTLNHKPKKISVIVHNQTILSNGYVAWAPKRVELFATPPQDTYPDSWLEHLCIHELRHVVQIDKLDQGITNILSLVFGQQAIGLVTGQLPMWYLEGDAVSTETALLKYGRGRMPYFERGIKTHLLSDEKRYSFDKMVFGSYKNYVPNHYKLGYQLTAYARAKYGASVWSNVQSHVAKNSYTLLPTPFAFHRGLKKNIGLSQEELYHEAFDYLDSTWTDQLENKYLNEPKYFQSYAISDYEDYINPIVVNENSVIALKDGLSHIPQFVLLNSNSEEVIYEPGYLVSNDFSYSNNLLVWAEYKPDMRWANREFTTIKVLNIKTKNEFEVVKNSRYFSPNLSPGSDKVVVVKVNKQNQSSLIVLNSFTGSVINEIRSNQGFIQRPRWSEDEKYIYVIEQVNSYKQVSRYNFENDKWEIVFKLPNVDIQRILPVDNYVFFHSTFNGTDNIYVFDESSKEIYQLSDSKFGISEFDYIANKNELITNEYTSQGFRLTTIPVERALWKKVNRNEVYKFELAEKLKEQEEIEYNQAYKEDYKYDSKPYRKYLNLFNFHSWIPFYVDYDEMDLGNVFADPSEIYSNIHPGITLLSQNNLSTTEAIIGYAYKDGNHYVSSSIELKGQYPVFKITANYGADQLVRTTSNSTWEPQTDIGYSYEAKIYVPFNLTKGKFINGIRPEVSVEYFDNLYYNYENNYYIEGLEIMQSRLLLYTYQRKADRDITTRLGVIFDFNLFNTPFESELYNYIYSADAIFYLPGRGSSSFKINVGYQFQDPLLYLFSSDFSFPRGIQNKRTEKMVKVYGDYIFPITYPDWNLGSLLYLKRIRGDIFADYAYNTYRTLNETQTTIIWPIDHNFSFGFELTADYHLLRTIFPLSTGLRVGYAPTENIPFFEVLFGIDLYSF